MNSPNLEAISRTLSSSDYESKSRRTNRLINPTEVDYCNNIFTKLERNKNELLHQSVMIKLGEIYEKLNRYDGSDLLPDITDEEIRDKLKKILNP